MRGRHRRIIAPHSLFLGFAEPSGVRGFQGVFACCVCARRVFLGTRKILIIIPNNCNYYVLSNSYFLARHKRSRWNHSETKKADEQRACAPGACSNRTGRTVAPERIHRSIHPFRPRQLQPTPGRRIFIYGERENRKNSLRAHGRRDKFTGNSPVLKTDG